jgi:hypothetical protein
MIAALIPIQSIGQINFLNQPLNHRNILTRTIANVLASGCIHKVIISAPIGLKIEIMGSGIKQGLLTLVPGVNIDFYMGTSWIRGLQEAVLTHQVDDVVLINPEQCFLPSAHISDMVLRYKEVNSKPITNESFFEPPFAIKVFPFYLLDQIKDLDQITIKWHTLAINGLPILKSLKKLDMLEDIAFADYMAAELDKGAYTDDLIEDFNANQSSA